MINIILIFVGKTISKVSKILNVGSGSTWPGHIALSVNKNFVHEVLKKSKIKIILIAGTNGKTTTAKLIQTIFENNKKKVFRNESGANLLNGIASSLLLHSSILSTLDYDYAIFEIDENSLPLALNELEPHTIILMNLFRDQLDRYGEVDSIAKKWKKALKKLSKETTLILNADDPQISFLGKNTKALYFGLNEKVRQSKQFSADSTYCPNCNSKLAYNTTFFSHLGDWKCNKCSEKRPKLDLEDSPFYPLPGIYNIYNTHAALLFAKINNINNLTIQQSLRMFTPAFGRQEIIKAGNKKIHLFLSKNPTSFNQSLRTVVELGGNNVLFVLNDRIPDGRDVSWIWDTNLEELLDTKQNITVSGDRTYDMALRIKYASSSKFQISNFKFQINDKLKNAINESLEKVQKNETLYVLPTYSAMLEVRKILTGKKIL
ncbi:MAG: MurT ligase domain-containing protein [Candidatus Levybacteria bacterium]|nr:MurT ligase domain-containing protein [Candidatus Levybacteria bacterium]